MIILNVSIKNNVTTSILHIYKNQEIIAKTIHYTMNVTSSNVKQVLFLLLEKSLIETSILNNFTLLPYQRTLEHFSKRT